MMDAKPDDGRRARKARETRARIAEAALGLFLKQGFDETTLDAIAEAADISRRSFFHYFASKEAILDTVDEGVHDAVRAALASSAPHQSPLVAVHKALRQVIERFSDAEVSAMDHLMRSTEALRLRKQANYVTQEKALHAALCEIWSAPARRPGLAMVAMIGIGAMRLATERWREAPHGRSLSRELDRAFEDARTVIGGGDIEFEAGP